MRKHAVLIVSVVAVVLLVFSKVHAERTVWYVHPDSTLNTIQAGLDSCADNDIVLVASGTYYENIVWPNTQGIHLISELGPEATIIDGNSTNSVIRITTGVDTTTIISGFTIQNGWDWGEGGGIYCSSSSPNLTNVIISGNYASLYGGGIYCGSSSPNLTNVIISGNYANDGGGIYCGSSSPNLTNVIISGNHAGLYGGGICCRDNSSPSLTNVTISGNQVWELDVNTHGGGIYCSNSNPSLTNVTITENSVSGSGWIPEGSGGGICCDNSSPSLTNVTITGNTAEGMFYMEGGKGGGIDCSDNSNPSLTNVIISGNTADDEGGGIYCDNSTLIFDAVNRCNIFLNFAGSGCDLYAFDCSTIDVIVDTFTVLQPDDYFAYPIDNFTFDILNGKVEQVNQDLYVSPTGSDDNSGLTPDDPLLTISYALMKIVADSADPHLIHLANGVYSPSQTGERFPLYCRSYVSLQGEDELSTILDGEGLSDILFCENDNNFSIENMTIQNSNAGGVRCNSSSPSLTNVTISGNTAYYGGGIYCRYSSPSLTNVTISGNTTGYYGNGGGIYCLYSSPSLTNVTISGNTTGYDGNGGGIYCRYSSPSLTNVTISGNTTGYNGNGGGIYCRDNSSPSLTNVTISGNTAGRNGGGIYCRDNSSPSILNCILWNDTPQEIYISSGSVTATYSDIQGGWPGTGNIDEDPVFVSGPLSNYHLCPFTPSPCIDAGNPDPQYNDPEDPLNPGYAMWPALGTVRNDMGVYGGPGTEGWVYIEEYKPPQPMSTVLQISPNPFRDRVNISFSIGQRIESIELKIYDATGRLVKEFGHTANQQLSQVIWAGNDNYGNKVPSGVYFLKFTTERVTETRKLLLIR